MNFYCKVRIVLHLFNAGEVWSPIFYATTIALSKKYPSDSQGFR